MSVLFVILRVVVALFFSFLAGAAAQYARAERRRRVNSALLSVGFSIVGGLLLLYWPINPVLLGIAGILWVVMFLSAYRLGSL